MSHITLDYLNILLREQQEKEENLKEIIEKVSPSVDTKEAIEGFYQQIGIRAPIKGIFNRPISDNVYKCPFSEPLTTLVNWDTLPRSVQNRYKKPDDDTNVLEVNRTDLLAEEVLREEGTLSSKGERSSSLTNGIQRRPLVGNCDAVWRRCRWRCSWGCGGGR